MDQLGTFWVHQRCPHYLEKWIKNRAHVQSFQYASTTVWVSNSWGDVSPHTIIPTNVWKQHDGLRLSSLCHCQWMNGSVSTENNGDYHGKRVKTRFDVPLLREHIARSLDKRIITQSDPVSGTRWELEGCTEGTPVFWTEPRGSRWQQTMGDPTGSVNWMLHRYMKKKKSKEGKGTKT